MKKRKLKNNWLLIVTLSLITIIFLVSLSIIKDGTIKNTSTYENDLFGYKLQLPVGYDVLDTTPTIFNDSHYIFFKKDKRNYISILTKKLYSDDEFINNPYDKKEFIGYIELDNIKAPSLIYPEGVCNHPDKSDCTPPFIFIKVDKFDRSYLITLNNTTKITKEYQNILDSLEFKK